METFCNTAIVQSLMNQLATVMTLLSLTQQLKLVIVPCQTQSLLEENASLVPIFPFTAMALPSIPQLATVTRLLPLTQQTKHVFVLSKTL